MSDTDFFEKLKTILGSERVLTDDADRGFYSQDIGNQGKTACAVIRPKTLDELSQSVRAATRTRMAVFPRGGGMSYTDGYIPSVERALVIDTGLMTQILEINEEDMYVTVQPGVTWDALH